MFGTKIKTDKLTVQLQDQSDSVASAAAAVADQLRERVVPAVGLATENARDWARPRVEHGIEVAAPKLGSAVNQLAPKVDLARDKIVDELIPRIAEAIAGWAAASAAAKDEALSRGQGAAAVITGDAVASPKGRKGQILMALGLLSAIAAAAMTLMKRSAPKDDPWTTPIAEPYVPASNGWQSPASKVGEPIATATTESEIIDPLGEVGTPSPMDPTADAPDPGKSDKTQS